MHSRCQYLARFAVLGILSSIVATSTVIPSQDLAKYKRVRISFYAQADCKHVLSKLVPLGFQPEGFSLPYELRGRLPVHALPSVVKIPGVYMVVEEITFRQPVAPERYAVQFRIKLEADSRAPTQRYPQYQALVKRLGEAGFVQAPLKPEEWRYNDILRGEIPATSVPTMLDIPNIRSILLTPINLSLLEDNKEPVLVEIWLANNLPYQQQQHVQQLAREALGKLGFLEALAYDTQFGLRLMGWLPANQVSSLLDAKYDLEQPAQPQTINLLARYPITLFRLAEVLSEPGKVPPPNLKVSPLAWPQPMVPDLKIHPDLKTQLEKLGSKEDSLRIEVVFREEKDTRELLRLLQSQAASIQLEGRLGPILWARVASKEITRLATISEVSSIRLPQPPLSVSSVATRELPCHYIRLGQNQPRHQSLGALLRFQEPMRVAVIACDFRGWESRLGQTLPRATYFLDYTRYMNPNLDPEPNPSVPDAGLRVAEEIARLAPLQELYLVRISETAPYQVGEILGSLDQPLERPPLVRQRMEELARLQANLAEEAGELRLRKRELLLNFRVDDPAYWKARDHYLRLEKNWQSRSKLYSERVARLSDQLELQRKLQTVNTVVIVPYWRDGYPAVPNIAPGLRWLSEYRSSRASIVQVVPDPDEADWHGWFRDVDANEAMEFRSLDLPSWVELQPMNWLSRRTGKLPRDNFTELNWLGWKPVGRSKQLDASDEFRGSLVSPFLPTQATVELILQWREVHDPRWSRHQDDIYRRPLAVFAMEVLEPAPGANVQLPADLYNLVAASEGLPERVEHHPRYGIYELRLRFRTAEEPKRYAVRLRGRIPASTVPVTVQPIERQIQEIWFRLSAKVVDNKWRQQGKTVWLTPGQIWSQ